MGRLSTHVLDTARGRPAQGIAVRLYRLSKAGPQLVCDTLTNADGRTESPLLSGEAFTEGTYEVVFAVGAYLRATAQVDGDRLFLDDVPVRFGVTDAAQHYHVPLLLSPYGYSTYRGS